MSGQFSKNNFEQNPSNLKKKRNNKSWATNDDSSLCDDEILNEKEIKAIKEDKWVEKHVPKPTKKELKYKRRINELEASSLKAPLSKKESKELKKLNKKYKKLYNYRHRDLSSNHTTLKCCLSAIVVVVVLVCTVVFGGYHFVVQPYTGVTLFELTDILGGLYKADEEKLITQKFDPVKDADAFFISLQNALYLDRKFTLDDLLHLIPSSAGGTGDESASVADLLDLAGEPVADGNGSITGSPYFDELLSETKFDFSTLKDYDGSKKVWEISDKMVAAIMQQVVLSADSIPQIKDLLGEYNISIKDSLVVRQCLIKKNNSDETTMQLTIQVKIRTLVDGILSGMDLGSLAFIKSIVPVLLPEHIYLSAVTTPLVDKAPTLGINSINDKSLQTLISTLDKKLLEGKIESTFNSIGKSIFSTFKSITEMVGGDGLTIAPSEFDDVNGVGTIKLDILQTAMKTMKVENVSSSDFLLMVKHLHSVDNNYKDADAYIDSNVTKPTSPEDFITSKDALFESYGIPKDQVSDITAENFLDKIDTIPQLINIKDSKIGEVELYKISNDELKKKSVLSDKALAQIMNNMITGKLGDDIKMNILELDMGTTEMRIIAQLDVSAMIDKQLGGQFGALKPLISSIFPNNMFIKIIIPNEKKADGSSCNVIFNYTKDGSSQEESDKMFETIAALMGSINGEGGNNAFNKETLIKKLDDSIYPILDNFKGDNADMPISFADGCLQLPTIYEVLATTINEGSSETDKLSPDTIQETMESYYTYDETTTKFDPVFGTIINNVEKTKLDDFISRELQNKFFIAGEIDENDVYTTMTTIGTKLDPANIDGAINLKGLKSNTIDADKMNLSITSLELAKLIIQSGQIDSIGDIGFYKNFTFVDMSVNKDTNTLSLVIAGNLDSSSSTITNGIKIENFAADYLVVQADVNLSDYTTKVKINNANDDNINTLLKIINKLTGSTSGNFDADSVGENIGNAIEEAFTTFANQGMPLTASNKVVDTPINGKQDGFTSNNIYRLITEKSTGKDNYISGDDQLLNSIIYKLNNLPGQTHSSDGTHTTSFTERVADPLVFKDDGTGKFLADGKFTKPGSDKEYSLINLDTDTNQLYVFDYYIGQQVKAHADTDTMELIKFVIMPNTRNEVYAQFVKDLDLSRDVAPDDLVANAGDNGIVFLQFKINSSEIGGNELTNKILPESIYGGAFIDFNTPLATDVRPFINNLTQEEVNYINRLIQGNDTAPSTNITDKFNNLIDTVKGATFTIGDDTTTLTFSDLFAKFTLDNAGGNIDLANICIGRFVKNMTAPTV